MKDLIRQLADTVSKGGNLLVDVGPTKEGTIPVIMQERLMQMGNWLKTNGEAVSELLRQSLVKFRSNLDPTLLQQIRII